MNYNILIGGAAGQGMKSLSKIISLSLKRHGYHVLTYTNYMSRIRGGHNYFVIQFSTEPVDSHKHKLNAILALNQETIDKHSPSLLDDGLILGDQSLTHEALTSVDTKMMNHPKSENMVLLGAFIKTFGLEPQIFIDVVHKVFKTNQVINKEAILKGYELTSSQYTSQPSSKDNHMLIDGNTSIALGAITAGVDVFSAYPMTPSTSIMNYLLKKQKDAGFIVEQAEDEIAAIHIALGASAAGRRGMTASSGGGLSLMVEAIGLTAITETPLVIVNVMRPGPATGMPTKTGQGDLSFLLTASQDELPRMIIALKNPEDAFYQTIRAFDLADKYQLPVFLLSDQYLADTSKTIPILDMDITLNRHLAKASEIDEIYKRYKITESGISPRIIPGQYERPVIADNHEHNEFGGITELPEERVAMHLKRLKKLDTLKEDLQEPNFIGSKDNDVILVGFGSTEGSIRDFIKNHPQISGMVFGDIHPLPTETLDRYKDKTLINVELNATGQMARLIRMETGIAMTDSILKFDGLQINSEDIKEALDGKYI